MYPTESSAPRHCMDLAEVAKARRHVTRFQPTPVPEEVLQAVFRTVRLAPSVENMQPWKFVLVTDEERKVKVAALAANQKWIAEAPVVVVALALLDQTNGLVGGYLSSYAVDLAFAIDHLLLAAVDHGLGACYVNAFDDEKLRDLVDAPSEARVVGIVPMGYPAEVPDPPGSKGPSEIVSYNAYH